MTKRLSIEKVIFPEDFSEVTQECVRRDGIHTQYFVVIQEQNEVSDLVSRLGRVGKGGRETEEEILEQLPGEIADSLIGLGWLMEHFGISGEEVSRWIKTKTELIQKLHSSETETI